MLLIEATDLVERFSTLAFSTHFPNQILQSLLQRVTIVTSSGRYAERVREIEHNSFMPQFFFQQRWCLSGNFEDMKRLAYLVSKKREIKCTDSINCMAQKETFDPFIMLSFVSVLIFNCISPTSTYFILHCLLPDATFAI